MPIEGVVLQMKSMHIDAIINFPFPTPPDRDALRRSEKLLTRLGAFKDSAVNTGAVGGEITELGRAMALFPLSPRFSRMLVSGQQHGCLPYVIAIVSALSVGDPFLHEEALDKDDDGSESDHEQDEGLSLIVSDKVRVKEARRIRRRAFFQSQQVNLFFCLGLKPFFLLIATDAFSTREPCQRRIPPFVCGRCVRICRGRSQILCRKLCQTEGAFCLSRAMMP
jgi:HrpA-like RNA helicase